MVSGQAHHGGPVDCGNGPLRLGCVISSYTVKERPCEIVSMWIRRLRIRTPLGTLVSYNPILFVRCLGEAATKNFSGLMRETCTLRMVADPSPQSMSHAVAHQPIKPARRSELYCSPDGGSIQSWFGTYQHRAIANGPAYALYKVQTNQTATDAAKAGALVAVDTAIILV